MQGGKEMFKIEGDTIHLTRGDKCIIGFEIEGYIFQVGDEIRFNVYEEEGMNKKPLLTKTVKVTEECTVLPIPLTSQQTKFGPMENESKIYWYEIEKKGDETPLGYDENGPKLLILYPEGADENAESQE